MFHNLILPIIIFALGAIALPFFPKGNLRGALSVFVPVFAGLMVFNWPEGSDVVLHIAGQQVELMLVDGLSRIFAIVFCLASLLCGIYAWHLRDTIQQVAALLYAGAAVGAVFAGDLISLFIFWELTAVSSVFLIWARRTEGAYHTGMRYLLIQVTSGVVLLGGIALHYQETGSIAFSQMYLSSTATWLMFLAFGVKAAFPFMHNWLQDSYPAATVTGTVVLSAFTTKLAIYAFARGFAGTELLIYIGAVMAIFPIFFAQVENDLRKVLAYSLNSQLGFMIVGVGIGTELAVNGAAAHAFASVLYKGLLFMGVGAVLYRTGTAKASDLGGLYRTMPLTMIFTIIGGISIAAMPLMSGFVTKSLILDAAAKEHMMWIWFALILASVGALANTAIKIPYYAFFGKDSGKRPSEAPNNMILAMGLTSLACVLIGVFPQVFYQLLPYEVEYKPYTVNHVMAQFQLIIFGALAFCVMLKFGLSPKQERSILLDSDWIYRNLLPAIFAPIATLTVAIYTAITGTFTSLMNQMVKLAYNQYGPTGRSVRVRPTGMMVFWITAMLGVVLLLNLA